MHLIIEPSVASSANSHGPKATYALRWTSDLEAREFCNDYADFLPGHSELIELLKFNQNSALAPN
jgi:hypothetical protein